MTTRKRNQSPVPPRRDAPKSLDTAQELTEKTDDVRTHNLLRPTIQAALTLMDYNASFGEISIGTLVDDLGQQCRLASDGNLQRAEAILTSQAHTLDAIFHTLARKAQRAEYLHQFDSFMRLSLKAQSQCRATLEALAAIKNPQTVAFVRQANIAHGPQQVNNGAADTSRAGKSETQQSKLLEQEHGERLDFGTAGAAGKVDPHVEAVVPLDRAEDD